MPPKTQKKKPKVPFGTRPEYSPRTPRPVAPSPTTPRLREPRLREPRLRLGEDQRGFQNTVQERPMGIQRPVPTVPTLMPGDISPDNPNLRLLADQRKYPTRHTARDDSAAGRKVQEDVLVGPSGTVPDTLRRRKLQEGPPLARPAVSAPTDGPATPGDIANYKEMINRLYPPTGEPYGPGEPQDQNRRTVYPHPDDPQRPSLSLGEDQRGFQNMVPKRPMGIQRRVPKIGGGTPAEVPRYPYRSEDPEQERRDRALKQRELDITDAKRKELGLLLARSGQPAGPLTMKRAGVTPGQLRAMGGQPYWGPPGGPSPAEGYLRSKGVSQQAIDISRRQAGGRGLAYGGDPIGRETRRYQTTKAELESRRADVRAANRARGEDMRDRIAAAKLSRELTAQMRRQLRRTGKAGGAAYSGMVHDITRRVGERATQGSRRRSAEQAAALAQTAGKTGKEARAIESHKMDMKERKQKLSDAQNNPDISNIHKHLLESKEKKLAAYWKSVNPKFYSDLAGVDAKPEKKRREWMAKHGASYRLMTEIAAIYAQYEGGQSDLVRDALNGSVGTKTLSTGNE